MAKDSSYSGDELDEIDTKEYIKRRLQFWNWRLWRTTGRPYLRLKKFDIPPHHISKEMEE